MINSDTIESDNDDLFKSLFKNDSEDDIKYKVVKEFFNTESIETDLRTTTDIPKKAIYSIIKLNIFANACKLFEIDNNMRRISDIIEETVLENYEALRISVDRKGRTEIFDKFLSSGKNNTNTNQEKSGILSKRVKV